MALAPLSITTINIRSAGKPEHLARLWAHMRNLKCTTFVFTEFRPNAAGLKLVQDLAADGYQHKAMSAVDPKHGRGVLIASQTSFYVGALPGLPSNHIGAVLRADFYDLTVYGVYFPQGDDRAILFDYLSEVARIHNEAGSQAIAIGDFNSGDDMLDIESNRGPKKIKRKIFTARGGFSAFGGVWTEAWRHLHPYASEYSWYSTKRLSGQKSGWRIDHAFVSNPLLPCVKAAEYLHYTRTEGLTDHSGLVVDLQ